MHHRILAAVTVTAAFVAHPLAAAGAEGHTFATRARVATGDDRNAPWTPRIAARPEFAAKPTGRAVGLARWRRSR